MPVSHSICCTGSCYLMEVALVCSVCFLVCFSEDKVKFKGTAAPGRCPRWKLSRQLSSSEGAALCGCKSSSLASSARCSQGEPVPLPFPFTLFVSLGNTMSCQNFLPCFHRILPFPPKRIIYLKLLTASIVRTIV